MSKKILHTLFALAAALILTGGFSMTVYAGGGEEYETEEVTEEPAEETTEDKAEEIPESDPLTPEGNATLVDDIYGGNKQLITVTTKAGNYFYILIDRAAEGENTVHFLNKVDEADLMDLIEDGQQKTETTVMPQTCTCTEKCEAGAVNESCPVCLNSLAKCTGKETVKEEPQPEETPKKKNNAGGTLLLLLIFLLGGGGAFYYFKFIKPGNTNKISSDFSDFDFEDEDEDTGYLDEPDEETATDNDREIFDTEDDTGDDL